MFRPSQEGKGRGAMKVLGLVTRPLACDQFLIPNALEFQILPESFKAYARKIVVFARKIGTPSREWWNVKDVRKIEALSMDIWTYCCSILTSRWGAFNSSKRRRFNCIFQVFQPMAGFWGEVWGDAWDRFAPPLRVFAPPLKSHAPPLGKVSTV